MITIISKAVFLQGKSIETFKTISTYLKSEFSRQASVGSFGSDSTFAGGEGEAGPPGVKITEIQAAWNVTNAIQGMFIVSLPFAVKQGGYWAIVAMVGIAHICCYTGKVRSFFLENLYIKPCILLLDSCSMSV